MSEFPPNIVDLASLRSERGPDPAEALVLMRSFMKIDDAELRKMIVELAEKFATAGLRK